MNYVELELTTPESEVKSYKLRLTSQNAQALEKVTGKTIQDYMKEESFTSKAVIFKYFLMWQRPNITTAEANSFVDLLMENDYDLQEMSILMVKVMVASGFFPKKTLEMLDKELQKM